MNRRLAAKASSRAPGTRSSPPPSPPPEPEGTPLVSVDLAPISVTYGIFSRLALALMVGTLLQLAGLYLFGSGFLLTRLELNDRSTCESYPGRDANEVVNARNGCWHEPRYKRAVFVVLDALRFDFAKYDEKLAAESKLKGTNASVPYYINKLPVFRDVLRDQPGHGLLFQVRADPPTTTLQRLKALTTGTLPTFVDAGSNFFGQVIAEDNLVNQFTDAGKRVIFMGDDTWENMYPNAMNESYPYPSLVVWDLHTVDNGVLTHLSPFLKRPKEDWDLLIAHFLGVDHAGHRYGPAHPAMGEKLTQMNGVLADLFKEVDDDTVVFVIGDHGMDPKGDHGGDSENEVNAGLFIYSKKPLVDKDPATAARLRRLIESESNLNLPDPFGYLKDQRTTPQIDFVPTIAMLLGIPIPFGNLGMVLPEVFMVRTAGKSATQNLFAAIRANARQIDLYIRKYSTHRMTAKMDVSAICQLFANAEQLHSTLPANASDDDLERLYLDYVKFTREALVAARKLWARFDVPLIVLGSIVLLLSLACGIAYGMTHWGYRQAPMYLTACAGAFAGGAAAYAGGLRAILLHFENAGDSATETTHEIIFGIAVGFMIVYLVTSIYQLRKRGGGGSGFRIPSINVLLGLALFLAHAATPASDNLTIFEDSYTTYLLQAFGLVSFARAFTVKVDKIRDQLVTYSSAFMFLTLLSSLSTICREEQDPHCYPTFYSAPHSSVAAPYTIILLVFLVPVVTFALKRVLKSSDNDNAIARTIPSVLLPLGLGVSAVYWALDTLDNYHVAAGGLNFAEIKYWWARLGLLSSSTSSLYVWLQAPNCVGIDVVETLTTQHGVVKDTKPQQRLCFLGIANPVGGSYAVFLSVIYMILVMFQKPMGGIMLSIAFLQLLCLLEILHVWRDKVDASSGDRIASLQKRHTEAAAAAAAGGNAAGKNPIKPLNIYEIDALDSSWTFLHMVAAYLLGSRYFFATGHQSTLASIQWDVGYIGLKDLNWTLSPLMLVFNTFAGPLLFALSAPLLAVWKRPLLHRTEARFSRQLGQGVLMYLGMVLASTVSATLLAGHFRRHLMVWRVFAPKFFFSAMILVLADVVVILGVGAMVLPIRSYASYLRTMKQLGIIV
ncbi:mannose-ethanolamine phosphotransferase gpi13 [Geranomyces michiganensis]|nr:mannose-ethanolamine phosphotransferase gpi13 [Geranomyces michiganensis]